MSNAPLPPPRRPDATQPLAGTGPRNGVAGPVSLDESEELRGRQLGPYRITGVLGRGGVGTVYRAEHRSLRRAVAIKLLPAEAARKPDTVRRFQQEAELAARLSHPNVVQVFDFGHDGQRHYLAMELVPGGSAADHIEANGPYPWPEATRIVADACRGLAAAHAAGLVHRDIKPANLLRAADGTIKLSDFGLAKSVGVDSSLTGEGKTVGTPQYMSPEQCQSQPIDARSDIYSLGATYYTLLTGAAPFVGDNWAALVYGHCFEPPPDPRRAIPTLPGACALVVEKAMAKSPTDRFRTAAELLATLEGLLASVAPGQAPGRALGEAKSGLGVAPTPTPREPIALPTALVPTTVLAPPATASTATGSGGLRLAATPRPRAADSGKMLVWGGLIGVCVTLLLVIAALVGFQAGRGSPSEKADGSAAATRPSRDADTDGSATDGPEELPRYRPPDHSQPVPASRDVFAVPPRSDPTKSDPPSLPATDDPLSDPLSGLPTPAEFAPLPAPNVELRTPRISLRLNERVRCVMFNLDSTKLFVGAGYFGSQPLGALRSCTVAGELLAECRELSEPPNCIMAMSLSPNGRELVVVGTSGELLVLDPVTLSVTSRFSSGSRDWKSGVAHSRSGARMYDSSSTSQITAWQLAGHAWKQLWGAQLPSRPLATKSALLSLAISPDDKTLAALAGDGELTLLDADTGSPILRWSTHRALGSRCVVWSPDGQLLATVSQSDPRVWLWDTAGRAVDEREFPAPLTAACFGPTGRVLAVGCSDGSIWLWQMADRQVIGGLIRANADARPMGRVLSLDWSRNARYIAAGTEDGVARVWDLQPWHTTVLSDVPAPPSRLSPVVLEGLSLNDPHRGGYTPAVPSQAFPPKTGPHVLQEQTPLLVNLMVRTAPDERLAEWRANRSADVIEYRLYLEPLRPTPALAARLSGLPRDGRRVLMGSGVVCTADSLPTRGTLAKSVRDLGILPGGDYRLWVKLLGTGDRKTVTQTLAVEFRLVPPGPELPKVQHAVPPIGKPKFKH